MLKQLQKVLLIRRLRDATIIEIRECVRSVLTRLFNFAQKKLQISLAHIVCSLKFLEFIKESQKDQKLLSIECFAVICFPVHLLRPISASCCYFTVCKNKPLNREDVRVYKLLWFYIFFLQRFANIVLLH